MTSGNSGALVLMSRPSRCVKTHVRVSHLSTAIPGGDRASRNVDWPPSRPKEAQNKRAQSAEKTPLTRPHKCELKREGRETIILPRRRISLVRSTRRVTQDADLRVISGFHQ